MTAITAVCAASRALAPAVVVLALATACGDARSTGMGPDKPTLGDALDDAPDSDEAGDAPDDVSLGGDVELCADVTCSGDATCRVLSSTTGAPLALCVPASCDESPPAGDACPQACETGYAVVDGETTCGCCALASEPTFRLCYDDKDCAGGERCDHAFCESACAPGFACAAVCAGRCQDAALVPTL